MSEQNLETFRRGVEAVRQGDLEAALDLADPTVVIEPLRAATEGAFIGHEGVRRFLADTAETFDVFEPEFTDIRDLGDSVLAIGSIRVRGRGSGVATQVPTAVIAEYREGLLSRYTDYGQARAALDAAGLEQ